MRAKEIIDRTLGEADERKGLRRYAQAAGVLPPYSRMDQIAVHARQMPEYAEYNSVIPSTADITFKGLSAAADPAKGVPACKAVAGIRAGLNCPDYISRADKTQSNAACDG
jgi:hypothetical protein